MHGVGKTVFEGDRIEDFQVEILGILPNAGPKESVILARLSGGPLEHTGVLQGMSGSPVFIDGKLLGAVAMAFPFSKDPIAAIRPIADMIRSAEGSGKPPTVQTPTIAEALRKGFFGPVPQAAESGFGEGKLINISTPLALGGFTTAAVEAFAPQLRALGLEPRQALSAGGASVSAGTAPFGDPARVRPGSMISVQLMQGDMNVGADGTVTWVDGDRVYAFGHRFMDVGSTGLPFSRSEVLTLLASVNTSFKISSPQELMGVISQDRDTAVSGSFGKRADMLPVDIAVHREGRLVESYHMSMVDDPMLTPLLLQMAVFSTLDATERGAGAATIGVRGTVQLSGGRSIQLNDIYAADNAAPQLASVSTVAPVAYILQSGFDSLKVKHISLDIEALEKKRSLDIGEVVASCHEARPGDTVDLAINLTGENGVDETRTASYRIPLGAQAGPVFFTAADGPQTSLLDLRFALSAQPTNPEQLLGLLERLRDNDKVYVRVWRPETSYPAGLDELPAPPPSVALIMAAEMGPSGVALGTMKNSRIAEMVIDSGGRMVSGSKTVQVEVKP